MFNECLILDTVVAVTTWCIQSAEYFFKFNFATFHSGFPFIAKKGWRSDESILPQGGTQVYK